MTRATMKKVGYTGALLTAAVGVAAGAWRLLSSVTDPRGSKHDSWNLDESDLDALDNEPQPGGPIVNQQALSAGSPETQADIVIEPLTPPVLNAPEIDLSMVATPAPAGMPEPDLEPPAQQHATERVQRAPGVPPEDNEDYHHEDDDEADYLGAQSFPASDPPGHY